MEFYFWVIFTPTNNLLFKIVYHIGLFEHDGLSGRLVFPLKEILAFKKMFASGMRSTRRCDNAVRSLINRRKAKFLRAYQFSNTHTLAILSLLLCLS